jgi:hypothetical protein
VAVVVDVATVARVVTACVALVTAGINVADNTLTTGGAQVWLVH